MFRLEQRNALSGIFSPLIATQYIQTRYEEVKKELIRSDQSGNMWIEKGDDNVKCFARFVQLLYGKTATTFHSAFLTVYPIHANLLNF